MVKGIREDGSLSLLYDQVTIFYSEEMNIFAV